MKVPVFSSTIRRKEMDAVLSCMVTERIGPGELNEKLVQQVKEAFGVDGCAAVRSPAIALKYALRALDLPPQSGVMLSALAPSWQYPAVQELGFKPMVLDVSAETALVTPVAVEEALKNGGRALLLHETLGNVPDFAAFAALNIPVIEDISQSAGALVALPGENGAGDLRETPAGRFGVYAILGLEEQDILTAGGGAVVIAPNRREWIVLKRQLECAPVTDILPDINSVLAWVQLKERKRNEQVRGEMRKLYVSNLMQQGRHTTFASANDKATNAVYSFPVVLSSGFGDVKQYASRKEIDIAPAFANSIVAKYGEELEGCLAAKSLFLRCALFPLYPRLGKAQTEKIAKVLATLP